MKNLIYLLFIYSTFAIADQPPIKTYSNGVHNNLTSAESAGTDFASTYTDGYATYLFTSITNLTSYNFKMNFTVTINSNGQSYNSDQYGSITTTCPAGETVVSVDVNQQITACTGSLPPPTCSAGTTLNPVTNQCESHCTAGARAVNTGTNGFIPSSSGMDTKSVCDSYSCEQSIDVDMCTTELCIGKLGRYTGAICSNPAPTPDQTPPLTPEQQKKQDCLKAGNSYGSVNGTLTCVAKTSPGATPTITKTANEKSTGDTSTKSETKTTVNDDGTVSSSTTTTVTNSSGSTTSTTTNNNSSPSGFCEQNPASEMCTGATQGEVIAPTGGYASGHKFYETKYPQGIDGIWNKAKTDIQESSIGSLANSFSPNLGDSGSAPSWTFNFNLGNNMNFGSFTLTTDSNLWAILRIILIISSLYLARSLIFGG